MIKDMKAYTDIHQSKKLADILPKDYIKFPNSAYTSNKDVTEFADKYSHIVWEKLMNNFKKIENYSIGCNDVSDIVLNAIIDTYIWLERQGEKKPTGNTKVLLQNYLSNVTRFVNQFKKDFGL